ncbi:NAD(P)-dependent alcohol dehydrogenase [Novosphingobium bradum]|uniref:NAD(P)-dependent alcohol dehydrogenase n=1 Tax=Novosphingobium bradum TaxID=1737444 RepID=A0ABV7IQ23_9SPHN
MKAIRIRHPATLDSLELVDMAPPPPPGPGEIQVRVRASSLNYHDYSVCAGLIPTADGRIPLSDAAGEVVALGEGVSGLALGDLVIGTFFPRPIGRHVPGSVFALTPGDGADGYARERINAPAETFTRAPAGWSAEEAATIPCAGLTAWRALVVDGALKPGDTVLVLGTGGVSIYALQIARAAGARVIATTSSDAKAERLKALGADHVINYRSDPEWGKTAFALAGNGVDHVVEIGGAATLPHSLMACGFGGHVAVIGGLSGYGGEVPTVLILARQLRVQGLLVGTPAHQAEFVRALETTAIRPVIDRAFPLADLAEAFRHQLSGRHFGKIVVTL